jgi:hypothetical protein
VKAPSDVSSTPERGRIETRILIVFSFWDRLRLLFGAPARVYVTTLTTLDPGRAESDSFVEVGRVDESPMQLEAPR